MRRPPTILLLVPGGVPVFQRIRASITRYQLEVGGFEASNDVFHTWAAWTDPSVHGIIGVPYGSLISRLHRLGKPFISISNRHANPALRRVTSDDVEVGRLAARHLLANGAKALWFFASQDTHFVRLRARGFAEIADQAGVPHRTVWMRPRPSDKILVYEHNVQLFMRRFAGEIPHGAGVLASEDSHAFAVVRAAREIGREIPDDFLLMGVNNVEGMGAHAWSGLTSVDLPCEEIGRRAIEWMLSAIHTGKPLQGDIVLPPSGVVIRDSTRRGKTGDPLVDSAMTIVRSADRIDVTGKTLAVELGVSRTTLYKRFKSSLGRTPKECLEEAQMDRARALLRDTRLTASEIGTRCGFAHPGSFLRAFRKVEGCTPIAYRDRTFNVR